MSTLDHPAPPKTRSNLEWDRVLEAVASRCMTPMGCELALHLPFAESREAGLICLAEAREACVALADGEPLPIPSLPNVDESVNRVRASGALGPAELRAMASVLAAARLLRRFLHSRRGALPALFAACSTDPTLDDVADEIAGSFEPDGSLSDRASPRLRELRSEYHASRQRMIARLEDVMAKYEAVLQDRFVTEREGRWVIPVRSDAHERFPGLVHATSASGSTLFVEPRAVIPLGNRLKVLEADVQREENEVYARLTAVLADSLPSIQAAVDAIARADVRGASAKLAEDLTLTFPTIDEKARIDLRAARHPLLVLDAIADRAAGRAAADVVPSDVSLEGGRGMIVSGPNAGGKTVALKAMGLAALMVRAGLPIACAEASSIGWFEVVLSDMGDDQSLHTNLSTFSAHVRNLASILDATRPGALVLLDEIATGTDPREGEALAAGVLDSLCARGGAVAATTHYEGLKALALADPRFQNASVGFNLVTMTPTFRLAQGVPGPSSALAVAKRFGMPQTVLDRAARFLTREDVGFESVVQKLNDERAALDLARQAAEAREHEADRARIRYEGALSEARERDERTVASETEALLAGVRRAREELRAAQAKLRSKKLDEAGLREASRMLDRVARDVAIGGELEPIALQTRGSDRDPVRPGELRKGVRVWVPRIRAEAEIVEVSGGSARVTAGSLKLTVSVDELRASAPAERLERSHAGTGSAPRRLHTSHHSPQSQEPPLQTSDNSCDLRGLRTDDALSLANTFLDRSLNEGRRLVFLIHGHGTGALKDAVRKDLRESRYVSHFRAGANGEGGDGVTIVWLQ